MTFSLTFCSVSLSIYSFSLAFCSVSLSIYSFSLTIYSFSLTIYSFSLPIYSFSLPLSRCADDHGWTPIHHAAAQGWDGLFAALLAKVGLAVYSLSSTIYAFSSTIYSLTLCILFRDYASSAIYLFSPYFFFSCFSFYVLTISALYSGR